MGPMWRPVSAPWGPPRRSRHREVGCCAGDCLLAGPRLVGCLSPGQPDPVRSRALKMAASAGLGTAAPRGDGALCPGARAWGGRGCCASTAQRTPLATPYPTWPVSSRFPNHPSPHSRLPVSSREIINGVTVTDGDNNELGCSRVSLGMGVQVGAWCGGGSSTTLVCRGRRRRASHRLWSPGSPWQHQE